MSIGVFAKLASFVAISAVVVTGVVVAPSVAPSAAAAEEVQAAISSSFPQTVSADALPTVQINGVVRDQAITGNTVFAGGEFTRARPAGSPAGTNEVVRSNILAYTLSTGVMVPSFAPTFNSTISEMAITPDGTRLFVVGNFTRVNDLVRNRVAVFDTSTMALLPLAPNVNGAIDSVAVTNTEAYFGGNFSTVNGQTRPKFGGVNTTANNVTLPVTVPVDNGRVQGIAVNADGSRVALAGSFTSIGSSTNPGYGLYMIRASDGAQLPMPVNNQVRNAGTTAGVTNLMSDGVNFYGTGWHYGGGGTAEGTWAASWATGAMVWIEDCHGDTYDVFSTGELVYAASHKHYCGNTAGFPETNPRSYHHSTVTTVSVEGVNTPDIYGYPDHPGEPRPEILNWYPDTAVGSFTGSTQAVWTVTGNQQYIVYGGEFPVVNGTQQQGLVRYAVRSIAPNDQGPRRSAAAWPVTVSSPLAGTVYIKIPTNVDRDDDTLTYRVYRESEASPPVFERTAVAQFWNGYTITATDRGQQPGANVRYRVTATDPYGNVAKSDWITVTISSNVVGPYAEAMFDSAPNSYWRLGEPSGTTAADTIGTRPLTLNGTVTKGVTGAITGDSNNAMTFAGTNTSYAATATGGSVPAPGSFTTEAWIKTTTIRGGKIIGFGGSATGSSSNYDRHVYMTNAGELYFGVHPGGVRTINTPTGDGIRYNDGNWHHVVASLGPDGMKLYIDGALQASRADVTGGQGYNGYWRVGGDNVSGWTSRSLSDYFAGTIDEVAVYGSVLPASAVAAHYAVGTTGVGVNQPPTAAFTVGTEDLTANVDASGSFDPDGTIASYTWNFGDGTPVETGVTQSHTYVDPGQYTVTLTLQDGDGASTSLAKSVTVTAPPPNQVPVAAFTATPTFLSVLFNGSGSADPDGSVASHSWDFGDGTPAVTGAQVTHEYTAADTYSVTLTVTDDEGATDTETKTVTVTEPSPPGSNVLAEDRFERTVPTGWGTADTGGAWSLTGAAGQFSVAGGAGRIISPASVSLTALLPAVSTTNSLVTAEFSLDKIAVGQYIYLHGRRVGANSYSLRAMIEAGGAVRLHLFRGSTNIGSGFVVPGLTLVAGEKYMMSLQVTGTSPTQLSGKMWQSGTTEPGWQKTASETTADMQFAGSVGLGSQIPGSAAGVGLAPVTVSFHSVKFIDPTIIVGPDPLPNQVPVAAFTATPTFLSVLFNGSGSADPDGSVASHSWDFGDGTPAVTGAQVTHEYTAADTYSVTLTVTDDEGATDTETKTVTVTAAPPANLLAEDLFERTAPTGWGTADTGGAWSLTGAAGQYSVAGGAGMVTVPASISLTALLPAVSTTNSLVTAEFSLDKIAVGQYIYLHGRRVGANAYSLRAMIEAGGAVRLHLFRGSTNIGSGFVVPGLTLVAGEKYMMSLQVTGTSPTQLSGKMWQSGTTEPGWQKTASETTADMQFAGSAGLGSFIPSSAAGVGLAPVAVSFHSFKVTVPPAP